MRATLIIGSAGPDVGYLHQALIEQGYPVGRDAMDGVYGLDTRNAVTVFQGGHCDEANRPLGVDGIVGPSTWWALSHPSGTEQGSTRDLPSTFVTPYPRDAPVIKAAVGELVANVREAPDGSNRGARIDVYTGLAGAPVGRPGPPWCALFVSWCWSQAEGGSPFGRMSNAQNIGLWGRHAGVAFDGPGSTPRPADVFVIARDDMHGHCGIVWTATPTVIYTIEGNSGNRVRALKREIASVTTFVRPSGKRAA